jgi:hypothetical protein
MKKTYQKPSMDVLDVAPCNMLQYSVKSFVDGGTTSVGDVGEVTSSSHSRDDDWDEEMDFMMLMSLFKK